MAKRGTLDHPKTLDLACRLEIMPPWALGLLEATWHWVAKYAPTGDVTNVKPALLASSIRYAGDPGAMVATASGGVLAAPLAATAA